MATNLSEDSVVMEKEFGKLSAGQMRQIYAHAYKFTSQGQDFQRWLEDDEISPFITSWSHLYDRPFSDLTALMVWFFDWNEPLNEIAKSGDPQQDFLVFIEQQNKEVEEMELTEEEREECREMMPFLITLMLAVKGNIDALSQRYRSICEMMEEVREGNDRALFEAITVDRSVVSCKTASDRIALAQGTGDERFMDQMAKAFKRSVPRRVDPEYNDFRLMYEILFEATGPDGPTTAQVQKILCEELDLYDPYSDGLQKMIQKRKKIKRK